MTIVVAANRMMAADSGESWGKIMRRAATPKIIRNDLGWLGAAAGPMNGVILFEQWFAEGMVYKDRPELDEENFMALLMNESGHVFKMEDSFLPYRVNEPGMIGEEVAEAFVMGAILSGAPLGKAVALACEHCIWAAGPVQVEAL